MKYEEKKQPAKITLAVDMENGKIVYDGHIVTFSGFMFDLFNINPDIIFIEDIAHGLANNCRWNGHTKEFFSVAQHSCMMYDEAPFKDKLKFLFHDSEEYAWGDMIKPLKNLIEKVYPEVIERMKDLRKIIYDKFSIEYADKAVKQMDSEMLFWEFENIIKTKNAEFWSPKRAKIEWLNRYYYYTKQLDKVTPINDVLEIKALMDNLTEEQRHELTLEYCSGCGSTNPYCQCRNDE